ncbi:copper chaperone PCu(A)C [soil metagenome]
MPKLVIEIAFAVSLTFAAIVSFVTQAYAGDVMVGHAMARASTTPAAKTGAVYFMLMNHGTAADRLISVKTDAAARAELHETAMENGIATMRKVDAIDIGPHAMISLKPSGQHVMLFGLKAPLKKGEHLTLTLTFETAGDIPVDVTVGDVAAGMDHSMPDEASGN